MKAPLKGAKKNNDSRKPLHIVGIGSSAGGLEALEQFFTHMPPDSGMAFVLVLHLDPTHKCIMPELIQRFTKMQVLQVEDLMNVEPNKVYTILPNKDLSILHGVLHLLEPLAPRGLRLPIDLFFRHLAIDQREMAICVILSGMGSDGTLGLKAIKENLGMAMVQAPDSAKYDGMPNSAIGTGLADYIAPAEELPAKLLGYIKHFPSAPTGALLLKEKAIPAMDKIIILLRSKTGHDFALYKNTTISRRIERRMSVHQIDTLNHYIRYLQENPQELDLLFKELLIGVTNFFRDPEAFDVLKEKAIPQILINRAKEGILRVWVPGCSTGEEAYSIAIIIKECLDMIKKMGDFKVQIFATDIDKDAIDKARQGIYPTNIAADISVKRLQRFFIRKDSGYQIKKDIREMVIFAPQSVIMDPPFTKIDLLTCRNLLIYLTNEMQKKIVTLFHYALNPQGVLFLGSSETIGSFSNLFSAIDNKWKIYERKELLYTPHILEFPSTLSSREAIGIKDKVMISEKTGAAISDIAERVLLESYAPPSVLINGRGDIIYIHGRTGKYLEPSSGKANMNIFAMLREGLRFVLASVIRKAISQKKDIILKGLKVKTNGVYQLINLTVKPLSQTESMRGLLMVIFEDVTASSRQKQGKGKTVLISKHVHVSERDKELEEELKYTKEYLQSTVEEMETSQEELKSANEEMQSINEELQSTNEELTTSKEELQSLNEELMTVNAELQTKIDELARSNTDLRTLFESTEIATILLDNDLNVKRFTQGARKIINLIQTDTGRPITHLVSNLEDEEWTDDVREVLRTLVSRERQVKTSDGFWYIMRIIPSRTLDNLIDGTVITFADITAIKQLEELLLESKSQLKEANAYAESIIATVREPLIVLDAELRIVSVNRSFYTTFQVTPEETEKCFIYELGNRQWDIPALRKLLEEILPQNAQFENFVVEHKFPKIGRKHMLLNARRILWNGEHTRLILLAIEDVTKRTEKSREE